jgi:hypothetical protein
MFGFWILQSRMRRAQKLTASDTRSRVVARLPERASEKALLGRGNKSNQ